MTHFLAMLQKKAGDVPDYSQMHYEDHRVNRGSEKVRLPHREKREENDV